MKLGGNLPPGHDALLISISGTGSFIRPVGQTRLYIQRPLSISRYALLGVRSKCSGTRLEKKILDKFRKSDLAVHIRTRQPPDHNDPRGSSPYWWDRLENNPPRVGHPQGGGGLELYNTSPKYISDGFIIAEKHLDVTLCVPNSGKIHTLLKRY